MSLNTEFDVVVVGAGPAGSMAAKFAAKGGAKVLLLDWRKEIGSPLRCAEGTGLDIKSKEFDINLTRDMYAQEIWNVKLVAPSGKEKIMQGGRCSGYILERRRFDKQLAIDAANAGARLITSAKVTEAVRHGEEVHIHADILGEAAKFTAPLVVAADGIISRTGAMLGINTTLSPENVDSCFQYEMGNIPLEDPTCIEMYAGTQIAPRGYIWIFPKGKNKANVGVGINGNNEIHAKHYLDTFIERKPELREGGKLQTMAGLVPVSGPLQQMTADNLIITGTAARLVCPVSGGGIWEAVASGKRAGETAAEAVKKSSFTGGFLKRYENRINPITTQFKTNLKLKNALEHFDDKAFEAGVEMLPEKPPKHFITYCVTQILSRPAMLRYVKYLI